MTQRFSARLTPEDRAATPYLAVPVDVPAGAGSIEVELTFDHQAGVIDLGCEGPGGWRGWSGGARQRFVITDDAATWGYLPGPLEPGVWHVVLGLYRVSAGGVAVSVRIDVPATGVVEPDPPAPPAAAPVSAGRRRALPGAAGLTWWACDFHAHTLHSDGALSVAQLAARAAGQGLDALAITDHNTVSGHRLLPDAAQRYGLTLIPGQEMTTDRGHANAFGAMPFVDFRRHPDQWAADVRAHGGLLSVNHPVAFDCSWQWTMHDRPGLVEAMHSSWSYAPTDTSIWSWLAARGADGLGVVGGSDFHTPGEGIEVGSPTTWVAAPDPSSDSLLDAVAAGRTALSMGPPLDGPVLVRDGDDLLAVGADGALHTDWEGRQRMVHGDRVRLAGDTPGLHRLVAADGRILAISP